eukprot:6491994-Amphidinium_carterae.1
MSSSFASSSFSPSNNDDFSSPSDGDGSGSSGSNVSMRSSGSSLLSGELAGERDRSLFFAMSL